MTEYSELVKALRCCTQNPPETCVGCTYNIGNNECAVRGMMCDAAAAIEELQDKVFELEEELNDADVAADDNERQIEALQAQLPKLGEWIYKPKDAIEMMFTLPKCSVCGHESSDANNYCPKCGAKMMEVQE